MFVPEKLYNCVFGLTLKQPGMEKRGRIYYAVYIQIANYLIY